MANAYCSFQGARMLLTLPPSFRTALYQQHCRTPYATLRATRLASSSSSASSAGQKGAAQKAKAIRPNIQAAAQKLAPRAKASYKPADKPLLTGYANYIDGVTSRGQGQRDPILLYKAPSHTNYYIACGFMSACFTVAAAGCVNTIHAAYGNPDVYRWPLQFLGIAAGACTWFLFRASTATRKLVHELWLLPRSPGAGVAAPRMVEVRCRSWPLPIGKDRTWTVPLEDVTLSRTFGSTFYGAERERNGRHSVAADTARDAAEYEVLREEERKNNGVLISTLTGVMERVWRVMLEARQVLHWYGLNAWLVVENKGSFRLDGRGIMLQGGKGLDNLFRQYKG